MNGRVTETPHNTPEQVEQYLRNALTAVDLIAPPDDLRVAMFTKAADLFAAKHIQIEQVQPVGGLMGIPRGN